MKAIILAVADKANYPTLASHSVYTNTRSAYAHALSNETGFSEDICYANQRFAVYGSSYCIVTQLLSCCCAQFTLDNALEVDIRDVNFIRSL